jgi:hypothetical protein
MAFLPVRCHQEIALILILCTAPFVFRSANPGAETPGY